MIKMKFIYSCLAFILIINPLWAQNETVDKNEIVGSWEGAIAVSDVELRVVFHIEIDENLKLIGTLDSPDQGVTGILLGEISIEESTVKIMIPEAIASYEGSLSGEKEMEGTWKQGGVEYPLKLTLITDK